MPLLNDTAATATVITPSSTTQSFTVDTTGAVGEIDSTSRDVWYKFQAPSRKNLRLKLTGSAGFKPNCRTYVGDNTGVGVFAYGMKTGDGTTSPGQTYNYSDVIHTDIGSPTWWYLRLSGWDADEMGSVTVEYQFVDPPIGDDIDDPVVVDLSNGFASFEFDNRNMSVMDGQLSEGTNGPTGWIRIEIFSSGDFIFDTIKLAGNDFPYFDIYLANNDPPTNFSPDLTFQDRVGDGTNDPSSKTLTFDAGDVLYLVVSSWNDDDAYSANLQQITISLPNICDASTHYNSDSTTITVLSDGIRDTQKLDPYTTDNDLEYGGLSAAVASLILDDCPSIPGRYRVFIGFRWTGIEATSSNVNFQEVEVGLRRNGLPLYPSREIGKGQFNSHGVREWEITQPIDGLARIAPPYLAWNPGDSIELCMFLDRTTVSYLNGRFPEITYVKFALAEAGNFPLPTFIYERDRYPLGVTSYDPTLSNHDLKTVVASVNDPDIRSKDMVITNDDSIWCVFAESHPAPIYNRLVLKKWDGAAWNTISTDLSGIEGTGDGSLDIYNCSMVTNGEDLWIVWNEWDFPSFPGSKKWRCKKYDVSANTFTELGTGQNHYANGGNSSGYTIPQVGISPSGDIWVVWCEQDPTGVGNNYPFAYKWNGSTWIDMNLPVPTPTAGGSINTETVDEMDINAVVIDFLPEDDNPQIMYNVQDVNATTWDKYRLYYYKYNGSTWNGFNFRAIDVWPMLQTGTEYERWTQGMNLFNDGTDTYFVGAFGVGGAGRGIHAAKKSGSSFVDISGRPRNIDSIWEAFTDSTMHTIYDPHADKIVMTSGYTWKAKPYMIIYQDNGDGFNWQSATKTLNPLWEKEFESRDRLAVNSQGRLFLFASHFPEVNNGSWIGVWGFTSLAAQNLGIIDLSRIRFRAYEQGDLDA